MNNKNLIIKPKKRKGEDGYRTFSIRIKEETLVQMEDICSKTGYSRNGLIGLFLEYAIQHCLIDK